MECPVCKRPVALARRSTRGSGRSAQEARETNGSAAAPVTLHSGYPQVTVVTQEPAPDGGEGAGQGIASSSSGLLPSVKEEPLQSVAVTVVTSGAESEADRVGATAEDGSGRRLTRSTSLAADSASAARGGRPSSFGERS